MCEQEAEWLKEHQTCCDRMGFANGSYLHGV